jgi:hypothetical protein
MFGEAARVHALAGHGRAPVTAALCHAERVRGLRIRRRRRGRVRPGRDYWCGRCRVAR